MHEVVITESGKKKLRETEFQLLLRFKKDNETPAQTLQRLIDTYGGGWQEALFEAIYNFY